MTTVAARFASKVDRSGGDDACWPWLSWVDDHGYGRFTLNYRSQHAHRIALVLDGRDPGSGYACHTCDNKVCVNPRHLYVGTAQTNRRDAVARGRATYNPLRGEASPRARLTTAQVTAIRGAEGISQRQLAVAYGVSQGHISRIRTGRNWSHA